MFRPLPDSEYGVDIMFTMFLMSKLDKLEKTILKRVLIIGVHNLTQDEKDFILDQLKQVS